MLQKHRSFNLTQFSELLTGVSGVQLMPEALSNDCEQLNFNRVLMIVKTGPPGRSATLGKGEENRVSS